MPPKRCPKCGRFLSNELVEGLADQASPCPRCETTLTPERVLGTATPASGDASSVRPPDLDPDEVRGRDVLEGWDLHATSVEVASWRTDRRPTPTDTIVVTSAALVGASLGAVLPRRHRALTTAAGALGGAVAAGAARRIWELRA